MNAEGFTTVIDRLEKENELKNGWISLISHDFKEIFGNLVWITEAVQNESISKDDFFKLLPRITTDSKKNLQTVIDTSEWIKTQMNGFELKRSKLFALDLFIKLRKEYEEKLATKKIDFQFTGDQNLVFENDSFLIFFILKKILDNAIKFSHANKAIQFKAFKDNDTIFLSIIDYGIGIEKENLESIFTFESPIFQGTNGEMGTGLSLKIVKNFVSLLNGEIEIDSTENSGTRITILLPEIEK